MNKIIPNNYTLATRFDLSWLGLKAALHLIVASGLSNWDTVLGLFNDLSRSLMSCLAGKTTRSEKDGLAATGAGAAAGAAPLAGTNSTWPVLGLNCWVGKAKSKN